MRKITLLLTMLVLLLVSCEPSEEAIAQAIAKTEAAMPTETTIPTATVTITRTPRPTQEPTATKTKIPTLTPAPTKTEVVLIDETCADTGPGFCEIPEWAYEPSNLPIVVITYEGTSNFVVWSVDGSGDNDDLLVNTIGNYSGTRMINWKSVDSAKYLSVERATGSWSILFTSLNKMTVLAEKRIVPGETYTGIFDDILVLTEDALSMTVSCTDSNFIIWGLSKDGYFNLLVNEIGPFTGTYLIKNYFVFDIQCGENWSFEVKE